MPRANYPSDSSQARILKAFEKLGFWRLPSRYGKGSHQLVRCPKTGEVITVQYQVYKVLIQKYCKRVEQLGYDVEEFIQYL